MILPALINAKTLNDHIVERPSALIIDVTAAESYTSAHLPGAVNIPPSALSSGIQPATGSLPDLDDFKALLEKAGLTPNKHVIVYDDAAGSWAGRMIWMLDLLGFEKSTLLDGGITAWRAEGLPVTDEVPKIKRSTLAPLQINTHLMADKEDILAHLEDDNYLIWDVRAPEEYSGVKAVSANSGHIPHAINLDWVNLYDANNNNTLLAAEDLQVLLNDAGLTADKTIITHCQTHRRSGLSYFVAAKLLGYKHIKAYPGSWAEWGNLPDLPIEK
jgi:thiosulfate/3-mercaptopyruvate sulfurtransferase